MEKKQRAAIMLLFIIAVFSLVPAMEKLTCSEPEPGLALLILERSGIIPTAPGCPTYTGTLLSILRNLVLAVAGGLIGYMGARGSLCKNDDEIVTVTVNGEEEKYARWVQRINSVMTKVEFPEDYLDESLIQKRDIF